MSKNARSDSRAAYWREQIEAWRRSGQSQQAYCQANDLSYPRFLYWRRKFAHGDEAGPRSSAFVPVAWPVPEASAGLSLVLPSGAELRGITAENLALVQELLRAIS